MVIKTLIYNIEKDLKEHFEEIENFKNITVKEIYKELPKINYPMITIQEFDNSEAARYTSNIGEEFSALGYQINFLSRNLPTMQASEAVREMMFETNKVLGEKYRMVRGVPTPVMPLPSDNTVFQSSIRYTCVFDLEQNRIYKN